MSVIINETNFPNENFRNYVSQYYDLDGDGVLSDEEIAEVTSFGPYSYGGAGCLQGLDFFTELVSLYTNIQCVKGVDFSKLENLKNVKFNSDVLTFSENAVELDFSYNTKLTAIEIRHMQYTNQSTSYYGDLKSLLLSPNLETLVFWVDYVKSSHAETAFDLPVLDFTNCSKIKSVTIEGFPVQSIIGLNNKQYLETIHIRDLPAAGDLDFSGDQRLKYLAVARIPNATSINVDECFSLMNIYLGEMNLRGTFNAEPFNDLTELTITGTSFFYLSIGQKNNLQVLQIATTPDKIAFGRVDIRGCPLIRKCTRNSVYFTSSSNIANIYVPTTSYGPSNAHMNYYAYGYNYDTNRFAYPIFQWDSRTVIVDVDQPVISEGPADALCPSGGTVQYTTRLEHLSQSVVYSSKISKLTYQWQVSVDNGDTWVNAYDTVNSFYSFVASKADSGNQYRCVVSNAAGTVTSEPAKLTVLNSPGINSELTISITGVDKQVTLVSDASGDELNYQWQISSDNTTWTDITENGTAETYSFAASLSHNHTYYRYRAWNLVGEAFSNSAELIIVTTPIVTTPPASVVKATGTEASFSANAQGEYLSFQWQVSSDNGESWTDIPDATEDSYSFTTARADSGNQYRCIVSNVAGTVTSGPATLTVYDVPTIVSRSVVPECVAEGTEVTLSVSAAGDELHYQWQVNQNAGWSDISGATEASYSFIAERTDTDKRFRCYISNVVGNVTCEIYDDPAHSSSGATLITVLYQPEIKIEEYHSLVRTGDQAAFILAVGGGRISSQWQESSDNGETWTDIPDATLTTYDFIAWKYFSGNQYRCHISNLAGEIYSIPETLTVLDPPVVNSELSIQIVAVGKTMELTSDASGDDLHYQWQVSTNNSAWTDIAENGTGETYSFTADVSQNHTFYRYRVWNSVDSIVSNSAELIVITKPNVTASPESQILADGSQATLAVSASGEALSYQWQASSDNGESWADVPDATTVTYAFTATKADSGKHYRCHVENIAGEAVSEAASLTVLFSPEVLTSPDVDEFVSEGTSVTLEAVASGDELSHKWYVKYGDVDQWYPIEVNENSQYTEQIVSEQESYQEDGTWHSGDKTVSLTFTATRELSGNQYRCEFSNDVRSDLSAATNALVVLFEPRITQIISPANAVRNGDPVSLAVIAEGGNLSYQWTVSTDNGENWENIADNENNNTYSLIATVSQNNYLYACTVTNLVGSYTSDPISFVVQVPPSVSQSPASVIVGNNATATFHAMFDGTQLHFQWQVSSDNGATWIELEETDSDTYVFTASIEKDGHLYRCRATNDLGFVTTGSALLTVLTYPAIITQPSSASVDYASNVVFLVSASGGNLFYQWQYSSDNGVTWRNISKNGTNATYSFLVADTQNGYQYRCLVANNLGSVTSDPATLTVIGSATSEDEHTDMVYPGKYLPSQMADMIRNLPVGTNLDDVAFGNKTAESLYATVGNPGSTDPAHYERIAEAVNEIKKLVRQMYGQV